MSTTTNKLAEYLKHNKFMAVTVVTGVVALAAIAGVMAWDGGSTKAVATGKPATSQQSDKKEDKKTEDVAATSEQSQQTGQVLGDSIDLGTTTNTGNVRVASNSNDNTVVNTPSAPAVETPVTPVPVTPAPVDPAPVDPTPVDPTPANAAPVVSLTTPAANATVSNTVTISADASDDKAVANVQFMLDGANLGAADATAPYSATWDTRTATNATHTLTAVATDSEGVKTTAASVSVTVNNTVVTPPVDPAKFDKARVSLTFDDGWKSIHDNALPILNKYGLKSTQYINGEPTLKSDPASPQYDYWTGYMNTSDIKDFANAGHEIAWHTNTHTYDLTTATPEQRAAELSPTQDFINLLMTVNVNLSDNFAAPFGTQSADSAAAAKAAGFNSYRTTYDGYNTKGATDIMNIKVKNVCAKDGVEACGGLKTTATEVASWIAQAQATNAWLVIVYHEVADTSVVDSEYSVGVAEFDAQMSAVKQSNVEVVTVEQALIDLTPQL